MKTLLLAILPASIAHSSTYFNSSLRLQVSRIVPGGYRLIGRTPAPSPGIAVPQDDLWIVQPGDLHMFDSEMQTLAREVQEARVPALSFQSVSDDQLRWLEGNPYIRYLDLVMVNSLGGAGLGHICRISNLEKLHLMGSGVSDQDWAQLAALPKLNRISMQFAHIGDEGLIGLSRCPALRNLSISTNGKVTVNGLRAVASIPSLKYLHVDPIAATRSEIKTLKTEFPDVQIELRAAGEGPGFWDHAAFVFRLLFSFGTLIWLFLTVGLGLLIAWPLRRFGIRIISSVSAWTWLWMAFLFIFWVPRLPLPAARSGVQYPLIPPWFLEGYPLWGLLSLVLAGVCLAQDRYSSRRSPRLWLLTLPLAVGAVLTAVLSMPVSYSTLVQ